MPMRCTDHRCRLPAVLSIILLAGPASADAAGLYTASLHDTLSANAVPAGEAVSGVQPLSIRLSAAGYMLDFRYRVLDPQAASKIIRRDAEPHLIDEARGSILRVPAPPKVGPLRHTGKNMLAGKQYFILFANPAKRVKAGDEVTVVIGEQRFPRLVVR